MARRSGFSMVELLVVIAIVGLLVAMMIPALSRAKDHARVVQCQTNLRSNATILEAYSGDNRGNYAKTSWEAASELLGSAAVSIVRNYQPGQSTRSWMCPGSNLPRYSLANTGYYQVTGTSPAPMPGLQTHFRIVAGRNNYGAADGSGTSARRDGGENDANNFGWLYTNARMSAIAAATFQTKPNRPIITQNHALATGPSRTIALQDMYAYSGATNVWRGYYGANWGRASHLGFDNVCTGLNSAYFDGHVSWVPHNRVVYANRFNVAYYVSIFYFP